MRPTNQLLVYSRLSLWLICVVLALIPVNKGLKTHGCFDRPQKFSTQIFGPDAGKRDVKHLHHHIGVMPERTRARLCLMFVSCHLSIRKTTSKSNLRDRMLDVSDEAGQHKVDTEGDVTLESWTGVFPISS